MTPFDPVNLSKTFRNRPILTRFVAAINLFAYPLIIPVAVVIAGISEVKGEIKSQLKTLVSAAFLPWKKSK